MWLENFTCFCRISIRIYKSGFYMFEGAFDEFKVSQELLYGLKCGQKLWFLWTFSFSLLLQHNRSVFIVFKIVRVVYV